ncbi:DUF2171 domain-containing protein [Sphingomonas sp.]|uniref:DUF2171 domain-containing protein n=1 Tax=Sphingomonas sp. TaxID=28214 RepID=UPI002B91C899|nr:DUF2171 domain-containing protein [Sphingomonas sp.]HWK36325.1 DUF2171 domain-containing protein [Sphingomonas sp.]
MVDDRFRNDDVTRGYNRREDQDYGRDFGSGRDYSYSSARNYEAAGMIGRDDRNFRGGGTGYGGGRSAPFERPGDERGYRGSYAHDGHRFAEGGRERRDHRAYDDRRSGYDPDDRGFMARAGDEVRSWFGDEEAERRRDRDVWYDEQQSRAASRRDGATTHGADRDYHAWRRGQIDALDRDYAEYRRENAAKFENEFGSWRSNRQGQRSLLQRVEEHMEVVGSDGEHVGTVDKVRGDRIVLTKNDPDAGGRHHSIPSSWLSTVEDKVSIAKTAEQAKAHWRDEERSRAFFGSDAEDDSARTTLGRSFSGTY